MGNSSTILALDISTHTGWACFRAGQLKDYGLIEISIDNYGGIKKPESHPDYPFNLIRASQNMNALILKLLQDTMPDLVVLENTTGGNKKRSSQRLLEWMHLDILNTLIDSKLAFMYLDPSEWRKILEMRLSAEEKKNNRQVSLGLTRGRITKKHLSVHLANKNFNLSLKLKDNDIADAINLGHAFIKRNQISIEATI